MFFFPVILFELEKPTASKGESKAAWTVYPRIVYPRTVYPRTVYPRTVYPMRMTPKTRSPRALRLTAVRAWPKSLQDATENRLRTPHPTSTKVPQCAT